MPIIKILNRDYQIACGPGEEQKLLDLAAKLDKRTHENSKSFRGANEIMLIVLTALTLENSVQDLSEQNATLQNKLAEGSICSDEDSNYLIDILSKRVDALSKKLS
jgi:cell division protein ZapA